MAAAPAGRGRLLIRSKTWATFRTLVPQLLDSTSIDFRTSVIRLLMLFFCGFSSWFLSPEIKYLQIPFVFL